MEVDFKEFKDQCNLTDEVEGDAMCMKTANCCNENTCPFNKRSLQNEAV